MSRRMASVIGCDGCGLEEIDDSGLSSEDFEIQLVVEHGWTVNRRNDFCSNCAKRDAALAALAGDTGEGQ